MSQDIITKRCYECKQTKNVSDFYKCRTKKDNCQPRCIACTKCYWQTQRYKHNQKHYQQSSKGKVANKSYNQSNKGKKRNQKWYKRSYAMHPDKWKARRAVGHAIRDGHLQPVSKFPCSCCGTTAEQYHHYMGYEKQFHLTVIPLCQNCHVS